IVRHELDWPGRRSAMVVGTARGRVARRRSEEAGEMARAYRYISADSHLEIDSRHWAPRVPAQHRERVPRVIRLPDGGDAWLVEGRPLREVPYDLYGGK